MTSTALSAQGYSKADAASVPSRARSGTPAIGLTETEETETETPASLSLRAITMFTKGLLFAAAAGATLTAGGTAFASSPGTHDEQAPLPGLPVDVIRGVEEISAIRVLDSSTLSFKVNRQAQYLVQFAPACTRLPYAQHIAMSNSTGAIYAGFDSVAADGQECRINRIYRL